MTADNGASGQEELQGTGDSDSARVLSRGEFATACSLAWTVTEVHTNDHAMASSGFGERILPGTLAVALVLGTAEGGVSVKTGDEVVAKFVAPIRPGQGVSVRESRDFVDCDAQWEGVGTKGEEVLVQIGIYRGPSQGGINEV